MSQQTLSASEQANLTRRRQMGSLWKAIFFGATLIGIIALLVLMLSIINQSFGLVAVQYKVDPATLSSTPLESLDTAGLINILSANLSGNRLRTLAREKALEDRSQADLYELVMDQVVQPEILASWHLDESILQRASIEATLAEKYPDAKLEFKSWLTWDFITSTMSSDAQNAGVRTALLGSLFLILITVLVAFPIGVGAAVYLEEYADKTRWYNRIIQTNIENLAGVPSIIYGILGLAIFVRGLEPLTSGSLFGVEDGNGRTILAAGLTMALLILPVIIINAREAIRAVPASLRQASYGLGATQWQTIWHHVLPAALPGILTGAILAISRAIGETAPLIVVGASTFIDQDPTSPFSRFTALPIQIYNWTSRPQSEFRNIAAAAILVLMISLLAMNTAAILFRNRFNKRAS